MSESVEEGKEITRNWISENAQSVKRVLDIGTGRGTYWNKFGCPGQILSHAEWVGVEAYEPYIRAWQLTGKYNQMLNEDARKLDYTKLGHFEIAFAGDVLEHMTKEEAITLVSQLKECCDRVYISIPIIHLPQAADANPFQLHVKDDWSHTEVMESFPVSRYWAGQIVGVYEV